MTNASQPDQMALWTRHTLTGVIGTWRGPRVPRARWVSAGAAKVEIISLPGVHPQARPTTSNGTPDKPVKKGRKSRTSAAEPQAARPSTGRQTSSHVKTQQDTTSKNQQVKARVGVKVPKVARTGQEKRYICTDRGHDARFDCGHNDYYHTNPPAGSYLATYWNMADSLWLVASGSTDPTPGFCSSYATKVTGSLNQGATAIQPNNSWYQSTTSGTHAGCVDGPDGTDFDLYLQKWNGSGWVDVAKAETEKPDETLSYSGTAGYYQYRVVAYAGSGSYTFGMNKP
jgi:hypothetical protein